jgi:hypothetical protein
MSNNQPTKTHWKKNFNYDYMGSYSLPEGQDLILTITETRKEMVTGSNGKKEECFVCYFKESDKPMILNRTNCKVIETLYSSPYTEDWPGHKVQIGIEKVNAFGETVEALRVREKIPVKRITIGLGHKSIPKFTEAIELGKSSIAKLQEMYDFTPDALSELQAVEIAATV